MQSNTFSAFFSGQKLITLNEVSSTNDYLKDRLSKSAPFKEGTVIMAVDQWKGRGQRGNKWLSEPGKNLTFSLLLKPTFLNIERQFDLNIAISVSVIQCLQMLLGNRILIKWPNDIYIGDQKLGGMLIENTISGAEWKESVVGIGINVNQDHFGELTRACSIKQLLQEEYIITDLLYELCGRIEANYLELKATGISQLKSIYIQHLFGHNQVREYSIDGVRVLGKIIDVSGEGHLILDFQGHHASFDFKEIVFVF
ncbi:biotin--[acetyl-CoA-carboxylase] ligase [Albibacterium profundi]|uniref:Biotin--[acetyl-CoA-carboxylase] ligase n=1 Tax=Albibacterium profundi TaxID=3134906 RepID=A0ABV5CDA6_9SPHI